MTADASIDDRIERIETIIDKLESGDPSLSEAATLRDEAHEHIETLREELAVSDGTVVELDE